MNNNIVLDQPPIHDFYLTKKRTIPYGLASIAACVKKVGFNVKIIDGLATAKSKALDYPTAFADLETFYGKKDISAFSLFHEFKHFGYSFEHIGNLVRKEAPLIVGISSLFTAYADQAIQTAKTIKKFYPNCKIAMGGHHPTVFPDAVLNQSFVDFVIRGEGEIPMAELCQAMKSGTDLKQIPGLCFKQDQKTHVVDPFWTQNLSNLPMPETNLINHHFYQRKKRISISIVCSRGCPMQCSYCSVSATSTHGRYRQRPVSDIVDEITKQIQDHDVGFIDFEDENLCLDKKWFFSLFKKITPFIKGKNIELRAMNGLYPPSIDEDIVRQMKASGFKTLNLALGASSKLQLKRFKRKDVTTSFEQALQLAKKYKLDCVSYIIGAAPGQTASSSLDDLIYLAQCRTLAGFSVFYPAPGSLDYNICKDQQLLPKHFCQMRSTALPIEDTTTRLQAVTLLRLSRIINFMKALKDSQGFLPSPIVFSDETIPVVQAKPDQSKPDLSRTEQARPLLSRSEWSKILLQWFLDDGKIRGIGMDGHVFEHRIDHGLTKDFLEKLKTIHIRGVLSG